MTSPETNSSVIDSAMETFRFNKNLADRALVQVPEEKLHVALEPNTNCLAVIVKHVAGNLLSRWTDFLTSDGEKPWRNRDEEFVNTFTGREEMLGYWEKGWNCLFDTLGGLTIEDLSGTVSIRGELHSVPLAIHRSLGHCCYHIGQIVLIARILTGDSWETLTIARGESSHFNQAVWGKGHYQKGPS